MNDEANVHYEATIDQLTEGHQFIYNTFGVRPRIGWQIGACGERFKSRWAADPRFS